MAGTTELFGFPFPTGSDRVMDGDNAIQALAEQVEEQLSGTGGVIPGTPYRAAAGVINISVPGTGAGASVVVTLPVGRFSQVPIVTCAATSTGYLLGAVGGVLAFQFSARVWNPSSVSSGGGLNWHAVQMSPSSGPALTPVDEAAGPEIVATCSTADCENAGHDITIYVGPLASAVFCGVCSQPITDLVSVDGSPVVLADPS